jgi:predicted alpha/beta-fold hydrolase
LQPFVPLFKNPHFQTIAGYLWPRPSAGKRFPVESRLFQTEPGVQVLVRTQRAAGAPRGDIVLVHGLEGSADSGYMRSVALCVVAAGYTAHRVNLRSCGGTEQLAHTSYHGGLTSDLLAVLCALEREGRAPMWLVGFSLGGNIVAKLAGELGADARPLIAGICAVSPAIDLEACARRVGQPDNRFYETRFVRLMGARACAVGRSTAADLQGIRTVIELDDRITAPSFGFTGAEHYYRTQSATQLLDLIRVPALFIAAKDDPWVPYQIYEHPAFQQNPCLHLLATEYGGHVGFIARGRPRLWLDHAIMEWIAEQGTKHPRTSSGN